MYFLIGYICYEGMFVFFGKLIFLVYDWIGVGDVFVSIIIYGEL